MLFMRKDNTIFRRVKLVTVRHFAVTVLAPKKILLLPISHFPSIYCAYEKFTFLHHLTRQYLFVKLRVDKLLKYSSAFPIECTHTSWVLTGKYVEATFNYFPVSERFASYWSPYTIWFWDFLNRYLFLTTFCFLSNFIHDVTSSSIISISVLYAALGFCDKRVGIFGFI